MRVSTDVKINLGLNVLGKRPDGYHDIETLFVPCSAFSDVINVEESASGEESFVLDGASWRVEDDLCFKALQLLKADFALPALDVRVEKHVPVGAGLGGGSADAAYFLRAVNELCGLGLSASRLAEYAASLGSDCAFFVYDRPMIGEGRGDVLSDFDIDLSRYEIRVDIPEGESVSTREAYSGLAVSGRHAGLPLREALLRPASEWKDLLRNDFEPSVFRRHPRIAALKQRFYDEGAVFALMSGSGAAVFGLFERQER